MFCVNSIGLEVVLAVSNFWMLHIIFHQKPINEYLSRVSKQIDFSKEIAAKQV